MPDYRIWRDFPEVSHEVKSLSCLKENKRCNDAFKLPTSALFLDSLIIFYPWSQLSCLFRASLPHLCINRNSPWCFAVIITDSLSPDSGIQKTRNKDRLLMEALWLARYSSARAAHQRRFWSKDNIRHRQGNCKCNHAKYKRNTSRMRWPPGKAKDGC